jgi:hypothetical protein
MDDDVASGIEVDPDYYREINKRWEMVCDLRLDADDEISSALA